MKRNELRPYVGHYVRIEWTPSCGGDWPYFTLLDVGERLAYLRGEDYPDGSAKHCGDEFTAPMRDIREIEIARRVKA